MFFICFLWNGKIGAWRLLVLSERAAVHSTVFLYAAHSWCAVGEHFCVSDYRTLRSRSCSFCSFSKLERMRTAVAKEELEEMAKYSFDSILDKDLKGDFVLSYLPLGICWAIFSASFEG